jgi:PLP dependent protein
LLFWQNTTPVTPNLHTVQTLTSAKTASALDKHLPPSRPPLNVFLQVNTSGEDSKSGLSPLSSSSSSSSPSSQANADAELVALARHVVSACPRLRLQGLMTIGSLGESLGSNERGANEDFERLRETRDVLQGVLAAEFGVGGREEGSGKCRWGEEEEGEGRLLLSMGMSSDFEAALGAGSDVVRVGTGIFGARPKKGGQ